MRKLLAIVLVVGALSVNRGAVAQTSHFSQYAGRYPSDLFKAEPEVKNRLRAILGNNYSTFMTHLETEGAFEVYHGILYSVGCLSHQCTDEDGVLLIDLSTGKIHCALHTARDPEHFVTYSEDPRNYPDSALKHAIDNP